MPVGENIKILRRREKLSQTEFAKRIGISQVAISKIELGETKPAETTLRVIASEFNVSIQWLLADKNESPNNSEHTTEIPMQEDNISWRELAMSQQQIILYLTKSNSTLSDSHKILAEASKIIAESNKMAMDSVDSSNKKIMQLLQNRGERNSRSENENRNSN